MMNTRQPLPATLRGRALRWLTALGAMAALGALGGCAGTPISNPDTAGSGSGVTVYGTVDAGVGRTNR